MEPTVVIISDQANLPLTSLEAILPSKRVSPDDIQASIALQAGAAVIALEDEAAGLHCARELRASNPALPLLYVTNRRDFDLALFKPAGHGPVQVLHAYADDAEELLHRVQNLLHPEYPVAVPRIAIVLPVYNEASRFENVKNFEAKLRQKLAASYPQISLHFVNDGSKDHTQDLVDTVIEKNSAIADEIPAYAPLSAHVLEKNSRKAGTYIEGIRSVRADTVIFADADDSFAVDDIATMINILQDGYWDMVIGTKDETAENRSPIRKAMSFVKRVLTRPLLPEGVIDSQTGLKALSGTAATHILPYLHENTGLAIDLEMVHIARRLNFRVLQIPVQCIDRDGSHVDVVKDGLKFLRSIVTIWSNNRTVSYTAANRIRSTGGQHA